MQIDLAISTAAYDGYSFEETFASIQKLGVTQVELAFIGGYTEAFSEDYFNDENADIINKLLAKYKLSCTAFSSQVDLTSEGIVSIFKNRMTFAKKVGANIIVTNAAPTENEELFYSNMKEIVAHAEKLKLYVGLENPGDGVQNLLNTGEISSEVVSRIGSKYIGINYDFGNLISHCYEKVAPEQDYKFCKDSTIHYHIKDVQSDENGWHFTAIGGGEIGYTEIFQDILKDEQQIPISLEIPLRLRRNSDAKPERSDSVVQLSVIEETLGKSIQFIHKAVA